MGLFAVEFPGDARVAACRGSGYSFSKVLPSMQKPDQRNHHDHWNPKKHDLAVVMQVPVKGIPDPREFQVRDHKDAQAISGRYNHSGGRT
jgi:hypothetical protein